MKAVFIDAVNHTVTDVDLPYAEEGYMAINNKLGCQTMTLAYSWDNFDVMFADDEGLMHNPSNFFILADYGQPIAGNGIILGGNEWGESIDVKTAAAEIRSKITFPSRHEVVSELALRAEERAAATRRIKNEVGLESISIKTTVPDMEI